tara:strand:+ start:4022 stop:4405 length:384 start_codon:yes stop_codon:yes gene_type:complete
MPQKRKYKAKNLYFAKDMRRNMTKEEFILWQEIKNKGLGVKFRRQYPVDNFIVDFISFDINLIIEIDGGQHSESKYDYNRDLYFMKKGFRVFRFFNHDVSNNLSGVVESIIYGIKDKNYNCNYNFLD